jgi:hypothetical protein
MCSSDETAEAAECRTQGGKRRESGGAGRPLERAGPGDGPRGHVEPPQPREGTGLSRAGNLGCAVTKFEIPVVGPHIPSHRDNLRKQREPAAPRAQAREGGRAPLPGGEERCAARGRAHITRETGGCRTRSVRGWRKPLP